LYSKHVNGGQIWYDKNTNVGALLELLEEKKINLMIWTSWEPALKGATSQRVTVALSASIRSAGRLICILLVWSSMNAQFLSLGLVVACMEH